MEDWGPSRTSEKALLEEEIDVFVIIDLYAQMENRPFNLQAKDEQAILNSF